MPYVLSTIPPIPLCILYSPTGSSVGDIYEHAGKDRIGPPSQVCTCVMSYSFLCSKEELDKALSNHMITASMLHLYTENGFKHSSTNSSFISLPTPYLLFHPPPNPQSLVLSKGTQQLVPRRALQTVRPEWNPPWKLMRVISGHLGWVRCIAMEPGNEWFATGSSDRTIKVCVGVVLFLPMAPYKV